MSYDITYYKNLITSEYQSSTKFLSWVEQLLSYLDDASTTVDAISAAFDIDNAYDGRLDIIGDIVGQSRTLNFQPADGSSPEMEDPTYRKALKAKIGLDMWKGQASSMTALWSVLFPNAAIIIRDNQDMTLDVLIAGTFSSLEKEMITNGYIIPRPEGVQINYSFGSQIPIFAYGIQNSYLDGYGKGYWIYPKDTLAAFSYDLNTSSFKGYDEGYWEYAQGGS
jgi:hypothetical protein